MAKKMVLIPQEMMEHLSAHPRRQDYLPSNAPFQKMVSLEREMKQLLSDRTVPNDVKVKMLTQLERLFAQYKQQLQNPLNPTSHPQSSLSPATSTDKEDSETVKGEEDDDHDALYSPALKEWPTPSREMTTTAVASTRSDFPWRRHVTETTPVDLRKKLALLMELLDNEPRFNWNAKGEMVVDGKLYKGSNAMDLMKYTLREHKNAGRPRGAVEFAQLLEHMNVPHHVVGNPDMWIVTSQQHTSKERKERSPSRKRQRPLTWQRL